MRTPQSRRRNPSLWAAVVWALALVLTGPSAWSQEVDLDLGTLNPGQSVTIEFEVTVNDPLPAGTTGVTNTATVTGDGGIIETAQVTTSVQVPTLLCDLDNSGGCDNTDVAIFISSFGQNVGANNPPDYDGDGIVGLNDYGLFLGFFP